MKYIIYGAYD